MSANSSSSCGASSSPPLCWPPDSPFMVLYVCMTTSAGTANAAAFTFVSIVLILPLCSFVFLLGHRRRRRHPGALTSHSDFFTYNMAAGDVVRIAGSSLAVCGALARLGWLVLSSNFLLNVVFTGQVYLHVLTCVERHLAVIHPVAYRSLRNERGVRIRNVGVGGVWLIALACTTNQFTASILVVLLLYLCGSVASILIVSFCTVSVLCVLIRPGPGEGGGARKQADQSKLRAFYTIAAILGVLTVKFGGNVIATAIYASMTLSVDASCGLWLSELWFSLPSSLVLPLLYLYRAGTLRRRGTAR